MLGQLAGPLEEKNKVGFILDILHQNKFQISKRIKNSKGEETIEVLDK